jgi:hypothetical protein
VAGWNPSDPFAAAQPQHSAEVCVVATLGCARPHTAVLFLLVCLICC